MNPIYWLGYDLRGCDGFKTQIHFESSRNHDTEIDSSYKGWAVIELFVLIVYDLSWGYDMFDDPMCGEYMVEWA